jgi:S-DNA-T family DNA segregation ATPase FtsK/SpoIIIE
MSDVALLALRSSKSEVGAKSETLSNYQKPNLGVFVATKYIAAQEKLSRELQDKAQLLTEKLERFGVSGTVVGIKRGPVVTLYEYQPDMDTKISKIIALEDDLALALQALSIRIIAPIPGKSVVGFEVANSERQPVTMAALVHSDAFTKSSAQLPCILGVDTTGDPMVADLARMPHLLIAGSTGSGKSVALNTLLTSLLCSRTPDECRLILIDPKRIEFAVYADIPHLLFPIVTDARTASLVLKWVVKHMEERYTILAQHGVRSSREFNQRIATKVITASPLPSLVVVIDELADLMITAGRDVEESIARIAQMARAAGIHLVVATQRPSVDVITGLIKVNFPSRMAFRVASRIDSRTILDTGGADKLLGKGDMLFLDGTSAQLQRLHGAYVSDEEIHAVVLQVKRAGRPQYKDLQAELATIPTDTAPVEDGLYQFRILKKLMKFLFHCCNVNLELAIIALHA